MTDQTTTTAPTLDQLAPYPKRAGDVTVDAILRTVLAQAQMGHTAMMEGPSWVEGPSPSRTEAVVTVTANWALAATLRALREVDPARAELVARDLWEGWEAGHIVGMEVWEWLTEAGIDPEQVSAAYRHRAARIAAETNTTEGMLSAPPVNRSAPPAVRYWRASLAPLDKTTADGRTLTGTAWILNGDDPATLWPPDMSPDADPVGQVDRVGVEDGRIIAYGQVWNQETADGMFSGRLRPEAGWVVPNSLAATTEDDGQQLRIVMSAGRLGYVKASAGPSAWPDEDDTWFAEDTTGGTP